MKIKDLMSKNVISVGPNDTASRALSLMKSARVHQLPVTEGKNTLGMLELKSLITKDFDPTSAKVSHFLKKVPSVDPEDDASMALEMLLGSGLRALPVISRGRLVGIISEVDIIKTADVGKINKETKLRDIMTPCVYVGMGEKASKIKNLMFETNVSRIPVVDEDRVMGVVGTLDLIKVLEAKSSTAQRGGKTKEKANREKVKTSDVEAESIMSKATVLDGSRKLLEAISLLQKNEEIIVKNGEIGIVTPKDLLALLAQKRKRGVYVQITGMHDESSEFQARMDSKVQEFVDKYAKMVDNIEYLFIHVEKMHKQGPKEKYSIRIRFKVPFGFFVSHAWGWKALDVIQEAFDKMEREIMKKYDKIRWHEKSQKSKAKRNP